MVGWVAKITRHTAIDARRKRRERATEDEELAALDPGASDTDLAEQADERAAMRSLIAQLPDNQAIVVPETIDAIRALTSAEREASASIAKTDAALGVGVLHW